MRLACAPHSKRAANAPATCTAAAHVRSARSLSYAAEPCCAGEWRIACATAFLSASPVNQNGLPAPLARD